MINPKSLLHCFLCSLLKKYDFFTYNIKILLLAHTQMIEGKNAEFLFCDSVLYARNVEAKKGLLSKLKAFTNFLIYLMI